MLETIEKKDKTFLHVIIFVALAALGWILPTIEPITPEGMHLLGVFLASIYGWSITKEVWPSLLTLLLLPCTGLVDLKGFLAISWGSDILLFVVLFFILIAFLDNTGTNSYIAAFLMTRKSLVGHPWRLIFMLFFCAWILSAFCRHYAGMLVTWAIIYKICDILGYKPFDKFPSLLIFGVAIMGALSLSTFPWAHNSLIVLNSYMASSGDSINYIHYLAYSLPFCILSIFGFMFLCKFIFRLDVSKLKNLDPNIFSKEELTLTTERKIALLSLLALVLLLLIPSLLPIENPIRIFGDKLGLSMKMIIILAGLSLVKINGNRVFNFPKLAAQSVPWGMIMMICGILAYVSLLGNEKTGLSAFLGKTLSPIFNNSSPILLILIVLSLTVILTNFMINTVVAIIMLNATLPIATNLGIEPLQLVYLLTVACTIAFMLPASSPAAVLLFSNTKWVQAKDVYKFGLPTIILLTIIALIWNLVVFMF